MYPLILFNGEELDPQMNDFSHARSSPFLVDRVLILLDCIRCSVQTCTTSERIDFASSPSVQIYLNKTHVTLAVNVFDLKEKSTLSLAFAASDLAYLESWVSIRKQATELFFCTLLCPTHQHHHDIDLAHTIFVVPRCVPKSRKHHIVDQEWRVNWAFLQGRD
jgi:hypothetical protein